MVDHKSKFLPIVLIICIVFLFIFYRSEKAVSTNVARSLKEMSDSYLTTNVTVIRLISEIKDLQQNIKMSEKSIEESKAKENDLKKKLEECNKNLAALSQTTVRPSTPKP